MRRKGQRRISAIPALLLCAALILSLCGCPSPKKAVENAVSTSGEAAPTETAPVDSGETPAVTPRDEGETQTDTAQTSPDSGETQADSGGTREDKWREGNLVSSPAEITTYNIVLVMDADGDMERADPRHSATNAACMFLDSLYASASEEGDERLFGVKNVNLSVLSYNDRVAPPASDTLLSLDSASNVKELKEYIWRIAFERGSSDSALGEALDRAVNMLYDFSRTRGGMRRDDTRYLVILATDGYGAGAPAPSVPVQPVPSIPIQPLPLSASEAEPPRATRLSADAGMPVFGGAGQSRLENALSHAREYGSEIFVLGLNADGGDAQWEQFRRLSEYAKRPATEQREKTGLWGGGIFSDINGGTEKFNYHIADSLVKAQWFYIKMAAAMLQSAPDPLNPDARSETIRSPERGVDEKFRRFDCDLQGGLSAVIFYALSSGSLSDVKLKGPDAKNPANSKDYTLSIRRQDEYGWDSEEHRIRNDWYEDASASTLTVLNPDAGKWQFYARCKDDDNASLDGYLVLVSGVDTEVRFLQGTDDERGEYPFNTGEISVAFTDLNGKRMPPDFYSKLTEKTCVVKSARFQSKPIPLSLQNDAGGNPVLVGTCEVPAPGTYRTELTIRSNQIDYSTPTASISFQPVVDRKIVVQKVPYTFGAPFLARP
ncbi:MAG: VWA domain-containing protein, partial [Oscillibacter sp.]|nr:VWA domain-containing protein [Oscillibacter sp.]